MLENQNNEMRKLQVKLNEHDNKCNQLGEKETEQSNKGRKEKQ